MLYFLTFYYYIRYRKVPIIGQVEENNLENMNKEDEENLSLTHNHYQYMTQKIISNIGGKENIVDFENCMTRLRLELKDSSLVNIERIKQTGAHGVIIIDKHHAQIVIGPEVNKVAKSLSKEIES